MPASINMAELDPESRKALGVRKPREQTFTTEDVRSWAIKALAVLSGLTQSERDRVLRHAARMNKLKSR